MLWIKSLHIIAVVCWFAVLFYLPRLFVYHSMCSKRDTIGRERFKIMERKLLRAIGMPSMVATLVFGVWLAGYNWSYYQEQVWFWLKCVCVVILVIYHHICIYYWKQFCADNNKRSHTFYRWFNEFPVVLLIIIVLLVVIKPQWV